MAAVRQHWTTRVGRTSEVARNTANWRDPLISYSRGVNKIIDLDALKALAWECYETLREES